LRFLARKAVIALPMPIGACTAMLWASCWSCMSRNWSSPLLSNSPSLSFAWRIDFSIMPVKTASKRCPAASRFSLDARRDVSVDTPPDGLPMGAMASLTG
jgi:hypothetical protein